MIFVKLKFKIFKYFFTNLQHENENKQIDTGVLIDTDELTKER